MHKSLLMLGLLLITAFAGCLDGGDDAPAEAEPMPSPPPAGVTPVTQRNTLDFQTNASLLAWSQTLDAGVFDILPGIGHTITVAMPVGTGLPTSEVHMGLFFPDNGCDWNNLLGIDPAPEAQMPIYPVGGPEIPDPCRLPVVSDIGPYFGEPVLGDVHATEPANRLGRFLIENLVPHGYIIAQVSVTGTGDSTGCMDMMGPVEQTGVQEAVRYLGDAAFSNGAVSVIGRSYDGSTPLEAAAAADLPQLKTIVPISGLYGQMDLMWKNGSAETRGPAVLWGLYYVFTYTGGDPVMAGEHFQADLYATQLASNAVCPDTQTGGAQAVAAYAYGGEVTFGGAQSANVYWEERRFREPMLTNYRGSVYFIHGMQDWNVDPHMAFPFYNELEGRGLDMKGLFGQWGHNYPDRVSEHPHLRWDWAQDLLEWFDHYMKGAEAAPELHVEMQDDHGQWRIEETWPPADLEWHTITIPGTSGTANPPFGANCPPATAPQVSPLCGFTYDLGVMDANNDTRIAGLPRFHVDVVPQVAGGQLYAELRDATADRRLGHAIMDLRFHAGGTEMQVVVPGQPITAMMEFFPFDGVLPAGNALELVVANTGRDYLPSVVSGPVTIVEGDLKLPLIERDGSTYFTPPETTR